MDRKHCRRLVGHLTRHINLQYEGCFKKSETKFTKSNKKKLNFILVNRLQYTFNIFPSETNTLIPTFLPLLEDLFKAILSHMLKFALYSHFDPFSFDERVRPFKFFFRVGYKKNCWGQHRAVGWVRHHFDLVLLEKSSYNFCCMRRCIAAVQFEATSLELPTFARNVHINQPLKHTFIIQGNRKVLPTKILKFY